MSLFGVTPEEEKPVELIEPEVVTAPKRPRKAKPSLEEQFKNIPTRQVVVDTLSDEDKQCPLCGTEMVPIGTELIRSEIVYTPPKLERIEYIATMYSCPECKDTEDRSLSKTTERRRLSPAVMFPNPCWHISCIRNTVCIFLYTAKNKTFSR